MLRDSLIGQLPAAALTNYVYLVVCILVGVIVFFLGSFMPFEKKIIKYADAIGPGATALSCAKGAMYECSAMGQVLCGVVSAKGGGVVRDVMSNSVPTILTSDFMQLLLIWALYLILVRTSTSLGVLFITCSLFVLLLE